jgi:hypothetical protein
MSKWAPDMARYYRRSLLLLSLILLSPVLLSTQNLLAQQVPDGVVLVLKLVSATHVRPTTGIVISADGLIMVPAGFIDEGDEVVVMDGGTDILSNARPARTIKRSVKEGIAVLSVEGLNRRPISLSNRALDPERVLHFTAFPVAEELANGAPPIWLAIKLSQDASNPQTGISASTALPNLSGAIIDNCGQLVGLNLSRGEPGANTNTKPALLAGKEWPYDEG